MNKVDTRVKSLASEHVGSGIWKNLCWLERLYHCNRLVRVLNLVRDPSAELLSTFPSPYIYLFAYLRTSMIICWRWIVIPLLLIQGSTRSLHSWHHVLTKRALAAWDQSKSSAWATLAPRTRW